MEEFFKNSTRCAAFGRHKAICVTRWSVLTVSLNRQEKAVVIEEVSAQFAAAQSVVIAEYRGLDVASITVLRKNARESGVYLRVLKNTLVRRAIKGTAFDGLTEQLVGPLIYAISPDPVLA